MGNPNLCGAEHPDWPLACCRAPHQDETHEGYGETWTDWNHSHAPAITDDQRGWFWMGWSRLLIAWVLGLIGGLIMLTMVPAGWPYTVALAGVAVIVVALVKLAWLATKFAWNNRRR